MLIQIAIACLTFFAIMGFGGAILAARSARREPLHMRLRELDEMMDSPSSTARTSPLMGYLQSVGNAFSSKKPTPELRRTLAQAGFHGANAAPLFIGAKMVLFFGGALLLTALAARSNMQPMSRLLLIAAGAAILSFLPNMYVRGRRRARQTRIRQTLPDTIDLLEICVSAGMGLEMAWNAVAEDIREVCPELADEMALTTLETHLGAPSAAAMRHMAERTEVQDLASLTAVLVQSERFGTSIAEALRTYATSMREERSVRAQEAAEKMAVKLILPMAMFIFPVAILIMAGPAFLQLNQALR